MEKLVPYSVGGFQLGSRGQGGPTREVGTPVICSCDIRGARVCRIKVERLEQTGV